MAIITLNNNSLSSVTALPAGVAGNYVLQDTEKYSYGTNVSASANSDDIAISGGTYLTLTPTSSNDIIVLIARVCLFTFGSNDGGGIKIVYDTGTPSGSSSIITQDGRYNAHYMFSIDQSSTNINQHCQITGLTSNQAYNFQIRGKVQTNDSVIFNYDGSGGDAISRHSLTGYLYKYVGV